MDSGTSACGRCHAAHLQRAEGDADQVATIHREMASARRALPDLLHVLAIQAPHH